MSEPPDREAATESRRRFARTAGVGAASNGVVVAIAAVEALLTARLLGAEGRGVLYLVTTTAATGALVLGISAGPALQVAIAQGRVSLRTGARSTVAACVVATAALVVIGASAWRLDLVDGLGPLVGALLGAELLILSVAPLFVAADRVPRRAMLEVIGGLLRLALVTILILGGGDTTRRALVGILVARSSQAALMAHSLWCGPAGPSEPGWRRRLLRFAVRQHIGTVAGRAAKRADTFLLAGFLGPAAVGVYSVAAALAELPLLAARAVHTSTVTFSASVGRSASRHVAQAARVVVATYVIVMPIFGIAAAALIQPVLGPDFQDAIAPLQILLVSTAGLGLYLVLSGHILGIDRPGVATFVVSLPLVLNLLASVLLIPRYGLVGNASATLLGAVGTAVGAVVYFRAVSGVPAAEVLLVRRGDLTGLLRSLRAGRRGTNRSPAET